MNLAQMKTLIAYANKAIDNFAAGNEAFERHRVDLRSTLLVREGEQMQPMTWIPFEFKVVNELHTVVLNQQGDIVGSNIERNR